MGTAVLRKNLVRALVLMGLGLGLPLSGEESFRAEAGPTGKIAGRVVDSETKEPIPGASILVQGTPLGSSSNPSGDYFVANIEPGVYSLRITAVGYSPVTVTGVKVRVDGTTDINVEMEETVLELGREIVITAERPLVDKHNTASRTIVESEEVLHRPVEQLSGVLVTLPSINIENGQILMRGRTLNEVSVLVDGARARNPIDQTPYTNVNLSAVQEMEVITGAFSAQYGEALSGVINVTTKEGSENLKVYTDVRYIPPGKKHWGPALYDYSSSLYWENSHARHLQWWIDYPDQWVDPNGTRGNDPATLWTPEQAYENYMATHQPLNDYTNQAGYFIESSLGGPIPILADFHFFVSGRFRSVAPTYGNSYRSKGEFFDGTAKLTYALGSGMKMMLAGFLGTERTSWGMSGEPDFFYASSFGINSRYAYYDFPGLPEDQTDGLTLKFTHVLDEGMMYEVRLSRVHASTSVDVFPDDPVGWEAAGPTQKDYLRAVDSEGNQIIGAYENPIGFNTNGYYFRHSDDNSDYELWTYFSNQLTRNWGLKGGFEFHYYDIDHFNEAKAPDRIDDSRRNPYQGAGWAECNVEFGGLILNAGLRFDFYNPNDVVYTDLFDPVNSPTEPTTTFSQLSPRLGVSHPIDDQTVLHFSYGHFFQRGPFGDYGEGNEDYQALGSLTDFREVGTNVPSILGNRNTKPQKTVAYEIGIERNFAEYFVLGLTAFYKDITNTIRVVTIQSPWGIYKTNGNGDYADVRGFEAWLRMVPARYSWGILFGYVNFTTQRSIYGRSGDPAVISPTDVLYNPSGDDIIHNNPRLKIGFTYTSPADMSFLAGILSDVQIVADYSVVYPNAKIFSDYFRFEGADYLRPADLNLNLRLSKMVRLLGGGLRLQAYLQVLNVTNEQYLNLVTFYGASTEDQRRFVQSGFDDVPLYDAIGTPLFPMSKYRNLPRSVQLGLIVEF